MSKPSNNSPKSGSPSRLRKVKEANFHQAIFVRDIGELGRTLSTQTNRQGTKTIDVDMETDGVSLFLKLSRNGTTVEAVVPSANVVTMVLVPQE